MARAILVIVVVGAIVIALGAMSRSWKRRIAAGSGLPPLAEPPVDRAGDALEIDHATYLGTVTSQHWLDRVAAQGLGHRGPTSLVVDIRGLVIDRIGTAALFIPQAAITNVELARGLAGRVYGKDGVVVVSWVWGGQALNTGVRIPAEHTRSALISRLAQLPSGQLWSDLGTAQSSTGEGQR